MMTMQPKELAWVTGLGGYTHPFSWAVASQQVTKGWTSLKVSLYLGSAYQMLKKELWQEPENPAGPPPPHKQDIYIYMYKHQKSISYIYIYILCLATVFVYTYIAMKVMKLGRGTSSTAFPPPRAPGLRTQARALLPSVGSFSCTRVHRV